MNNSESDPANKHSQSQTTETDSIHRHKTVSFKIPTWQLDRPHLPANPRWRSGIMALAFLAVAILGGFAGGYVENTNGNGLFATDLSNQKKIATTQSQLISQIAKTVGPSVVSIDVSIADTTGDGSSSQLGTAPPLALEAAGTGIVISSDGLIVTNRHVVPVGTTKVRVTLSDGTVFNNVDVIGRTSPSDSLDVAFLKINDTKGHKLVPAVIGNSDNVQVGDDVVAIGNALGQFRNTVTSGIISGYGRSVQAGSGGDSNPFAQPSADTENLDNLFQTDAAINEGNSGGPLTNLNGQVIGINTAIAGNAQNIGFAIPVNDVKGLLDRVVKTGKFERPFLGVHYASLSADTASQLSVAVPNGAYILPTTDPAQPSIVQGSPADKAGLREKDVISQVDGRKIDQTHTLVGLLNNHQPGDIVTLNIIRDGKTQKITVTLGTPPKT